MKVHIACSARQLDVYKDKYLQICEEIKKLGHEITFEWIEDAWLRQKGLLPKTERKVTYQKILESLDAADVLVVEGTVESFSVAYQITHALQHEKPVLFLVYEEEAHNSDFQDQFADKIKSSLITFETYTEKNIQNILKSFFTLFKDGGKFRFNLMLDKDVRAYLNWASGHYKKTKSEIIRRLLLKAADEDPLFNPKTIKQD